MKQILFILLIAISLQAEMSKYTKLYFEAGGVLTKEVKLLMKNDKLFNEGIAALELKKMYSVSKDNNTVHFDSPQWDNALKKFIESSFNNKNPISSYLGMYIIKTYSSQEFYLKEFNQMATILYEKEKHICSSYINYAELFYSGIAQKKDLKKALSIYQDGLNSECAKGWYVQVLGSKIIAIERILKKQKYE